MQDGSVISVPVERDPWGELYGPPSLTIGIHRTISGKNYPAVSSSDKETMRQIATGVKAAFSKQ